MKLKLVLTTALIALAGSVTVSAATLSVGESVSPVAGGLWDYSYAFQISGTGTIDNVYLGSDDLSPLNVTITFDGNPAVNWSWLGNDTPQNYLDFFTVGAGLAQSDVLDVTFATPLPPCACQFGVGLNSATGAQTNTVTGLAAPTVTPEPSTVLLAVPAFALLSWFRRRSARPL